MPVPLNFALARLDAVPALAADEVQLWWLADPAAAAAQRTLLAHAAGRPSDAVALARGAHGKPYVDGGGTLAFNRSHSGDHVLLALARGTDVGVDLEAPRVVRRRDGLLAKCFGPAERAAIGGDDGRLLDYWAAKEALVKAIGRGIAYGLQRVEIGRDGDRLVVAALEGPAAPAGGWQLASYALPDGYRAALAWRGAARRVRAFRIA